MDREAKDQYLLVIQAKDMVGQNGGLSGTTSVTVTLTDVNDNPPRFPRSKLFCLMLQVPHFHCQPLELSFERKFFQIFLKQVIILLHFPIVLFYRGMVLIQKCRIVRVLKVKRGSPVFVLLLSSI